MTIPLHELRAHISPLLKSDFEQSQIFKKKKKKMDLFLQFLELDVDCKISAVVVWIGNRHYDSACVIN
jgi:hypothetical protein